ncbi:TetR/AcrR family transcriptional regulator [Rhodobacter sp. NSM]|uniref:TetR/AcrR family transcriptional regulator n=1 Tax=Rhodobacter sp. NSM TaxID=3457501 RepID=UPI003FD3F93D
MGSIREERRADLRTRLIDAAETQIAARGLAGLKAREVTAEAGCALGGLYTAFEDLDRLALHVNSRTLARLGEALRQASPGEGPPATTLTALALGYVAFARENLRLWSALFDHRLPEGVPMPDWHRADHQVLIERITGPLSVLRPDLGPEALELRAKTLFAAVHGVVALALQGRFTGTPRDRLESEVTALVAAMTRGLGTG